MVRVYFDTEFTGLHKSTTLVSIGCVAETGEEFYAELTDYDRSQVDRWIQDFVIQHLVFKDGREPISSGNLTECMGTRAEVADALAAWLSRFGAVEMWSDCLGFDWVLFCDLFGHAFKVPQIVHYISFDLSTYLRAKGIAPDVSREKFAGYKRIDAKYNALHVARAIRACVGKLEAMP